MYANQNMKKTFKITESMHQKKLLCREFDIASPKISSNIPNLRIALRIISKENRHKCSLLKSKTINVLYCMMVFAFCHFLFWKTKV